MRWLDKLILVYIADVCTVYQMYKHEDIPPALMCVRRDNSAHLPSPHRCRHSNDRIRSNDHLPGTELPITTSLDDMIDALDHDISYVARDISDTAVRPTSSEDTSTASYNSPLSFQMLS